MNLFELLVSYTLQKLDELSNPTSLKTFTEQRDRILKSFDNTDSESKLFIVTFTKPDGTIVEATIGQYLSGQRVEVVKIEPKKEEGQETAFDEILFDYTPVKSIHEGSKTADLEELIKQENINNMDCGDLQYRIDYTIAEIDNWPEFKVVWIWKMVTIGCLKTYLFLPVLWRQINKKTLIAYVAHAEVYDDLIKRQLESCAQKAALNAAVIGIVTEDLEQAVNTFRVLFIDCIEYNIKKDLTCLIPGLFIFTEEGAWGEFKWL